MLDEVREHVEKAKGELARGALAEAAAALAEAVRLAPGEVALRQRLAGVQLRLGHRAHALVELEHAAGRYAAEGELLRALALCKLIAAVDPDRRQALQALTDLYALHLEGGQTALLPASMAGALASQEPAPDLDLEALRPFRPPLPPPAADEPALPPAPEAREIDLGPLPPSPLLSALDRDAFAALALAVELRWVSAGEVVVEEGQPGDSMFIVAQGVVDVRHAGKVVAVMPEGSFFGEMALLGDAPRLATVSATRNGLLFEVQRARLQQIVAARPAVGKVIDAFCRDRLLANVLRASPVFRPLSERERSAIREQFVRHTLQPGQVALTQGERGRGFHVILRGKCDALHQTEKGEVPLRQMREGEVFGEISLLLDGPCTATVRAASFCEVLELPRDAFRAHVLANAEVRAMIEKIADERLARTAEVLERPQRVLKDYLV